MKPTIEKLNDDNYIINKDKNFKTIFEYTYLIYNHFIKDFEKFSKKKYEEKEKFTKLINNIKSENKVSILTEEEIKLLSEWIDTICNISLEKENVDLKNKEINDFFKKASIFNKKIKQLIFKKK